MYDYSIGIGALKAVQKALDVVGNNIANAASEGYHKQRIDLRPAPSLKSGTIVFGTGVKVEDVVRLVDRLVEMELLRQQSLLSQSDTEVSMLKMVENVFSELSTEDGGLSAAIDTFFNSFKDLSAHPDDPVYQNQVINDAEAMTNQFRIVGEYLTTLESEIRFETDNLVESINTLTTQISNLNDSIERVEVLGGTANSVRDERDQLVTDLAKLVRIETIQRDYGVIDVSIHGMPVVIGSSSTDIEAGYDDGGDLGIALTGSGLYQDNIPGGRLGGLLSLKNTLINDIHSDLDTLADTIMLQVNKQHVQGVGSAGAFTSLTGWTVTSADVSDLSPTVSNGSLFIRVTNTSTGVITRNEIPIVASSDTLTDLASDISLITGLNATFSGSKLSIYSDANYEFDFLPSVLSSPTATNFNGSSPPTVTVSGVYSGTVNQTLTFTVSGTASVGNGTLQLTVTDGSSNTIANFSVGSGYAVGDQLDLGNGIKITLSTGDFADGDTFEVDVFGDTDTSDFLSAVGINTFFSGTGADDITVSSEIRTTPDRIATALGGDMTDNTNALKIAAIEDEEFASLSSLTCGEFYRNSSTNLGQVISVKQMQQDSIQATVQNLLNQQSDMSGVDINEEAAQLLVYEQMFQSIAKYMMTIRTTMTSIMEIL